MRGRPLGSKNKPKLAVVHGDGFHPAQLREVVAEIESGYDELAAAKSDYMIVCRRIREGITELVNDAVAHGIPKAELKALIKTRALERKAERIRDKLEDAGVYDQMIAALGDLATTPLGMAAIEHRPEPAA